jgi:hypothetical protein
MLVAVMYKYFKLNFLKNTNGFFVMNILPPNKELSQYGNPVVPMVRTHQLKHFQNLEGVKIVIVFHSVNKLQMQGLKNEEFLTYETTCTNEMAERTTSENYCQKRPALSGGRPGQAARGTCRHCQTRQEHAANAKPGMEAGR